MAREYDETTITPSDYVLYLRLSVAQREEFNQYCRDARQTEKQASRGEIFDSWLMSNFDLFSQDTRVNILHIDPIFDNRDIIATFKERGLAISGKDYELVKELEDKIDVKK